MKKIFTLLLACSSFQVFAQTAAFMRTTHGSVTPKKKIFPSSMWYVRVGMGYGFRQDGQATNGYGTPYSGAANYTANGATVTLNDFSVNKVSFNAGMLATIAAGYMFDHHVGVELAGQFNIEPVKYTYDAKNYLLSGYPANSSTTTYAKSPIMIIPSFLLQTGDDGFNVYTRLGLVLPINTKLERHVRVDYLAGGPNGSRNKEYTNELSSKFGMGYTGALGVSYKADKVKVWAEVNVMSLSTTVTKEQVKSFSQDSNPIPLQYITPGTVNYVQSGSYGAHTGYAYTVPFGYIGGMVGISFKI